MTSLRPEEPVSAVSPLQQVIADLAEVEEYFRQRADAESFSDSGGPIGNEEMTMLVYVDRAKASLIALSTLPAQGAVTEAMAKLVEFRILALRAREVPFRISESQSSYSQVFDDVIDKHIPALQAAMKDVP